MKRTAGPGTTTERAQAFSAPGRDRQRLRRPVDPVLCTASELACKAPVVTVTTNEYKIGWDRSGLAAPNALRAFGAYFFRIYQKTEPSEKESEP